jgi:hypothetical protein
MADDKKRNTLLGRENFLPWKNQIEGILLTEDILEIRKTPNPNNVAETIETIDIAGPDVLTTKVNEKRQKE